MSALGVLFRILIAFDIALCALNLSVENYGMAIIMGLLAVANVAVLDMIENGEKRDASK